MKNRATFQEKQACHSEECGRVRKSKSAIDKKLEYLAKFLIMISVGEPHNFFAARASEKN
jgi:hypothetical protein